MAFLLSIIKKVFSLDSGEIEIEEPVPKYHFPDTIEKFGYRFNEKGELKDIETGEGFKFRIREDDFQYNQQRYDALGELVTEYLYEKLEKELHLEKVYIPLDARKTDPQSFIFISRGAMTNPDKLMVLIHGSGAVRAGQWSRKLIINESIDKGSQLPYIRRAMAEGYEVMVLNPNFNHVARDGKWVPIKGSKTPEEHGVYIWRYFISPCKAQNIAIVAHSYGGIVTMHMIENYLDEMRNRVFAIAFTDSVHTMQRHLWRGPAKAFIKERAVNFGASYVPLNTLLQTSDPDDCQSVSAGTQEHERTSHCAFDLVFKFFRDNYVTWTRNRTFADRHWLPLPEDLTPYMPATKWNLKLKEAEMKAEVKIVNEQKAEGAEGEKKEGEEEGKSGEAGASASAVGGEGATAVLKEGGEGKKEVEKSAESQEKSAEMPTAAIEAKPAESAQEPATSDNATAPSDVQSQPVSSDDMAAAAVMSPAATSDDTTAATSPSAASDDATATSVLQSPPAPSTEGAGGDGKTDDDKMAETPSATENSNTEAETDAGQVAVDMEPAAVGSHGDAAGESKMSETAQQPEGTKELKSEL